MIRMMGKCAVCSLFFLFCAGSAIAGQRILIPEGVYYHRFASSVDNLEATWINPAGLGQSKDIKLQYIGVLGEGGLNKKWGYNIVGDGVGIGYRGLTDLSGERYDEYIFAVGAGLAQKFYWGLSYRHIKNGPTIYNKRHLWNIGLLLQSGYRFSMAAVFSNLNRGRIEGERTDIEQLYSFSYKPNGNKITFSMEITLSSGQNLSKANYNYGAEINAWRGLAVYGNIRDNNSFEIGFVLNLRKYFIGSQSRFNSDGSYSDSPTFVGYNTGLQHSFIP